MWTKKRNYCKDSKTNRGGGRGGGGGRESPVGGQGGCERRIEVIVKMQKKSGVRSGIWGSRGGGWSRGGG